MKKRLLLITLMVALFVCVFVISASAQGPKDLFSDPIILDDIGMTNQFAQNDTSRVVFVDPDDSTKYYTYPAYYIFTMRYHNSEGNQPVFNLTNLNKATGRTDAGKEFSAAHIICLEIPEACTAVSPTFTKTNTMSNVKYVKISSTVASIHDSAFKALKNLEILEFVNNTASGAELRVGKYVFDDCDALVRVDLPVQLKTLGERALGDCANLQTVTFAPGTDFTLYNSDGTIKNNNLYAVFINDPKLKSISLPEGITSTGYLMCGGCSALEYVYIPASCKAFDGETFNNCYALKTIEFAPGSQLQTIDKKSIAESSVIESITFPNTFISAGGEAPIRNLSNLTYINFGASFTGFTGYASMYSTNNKNLVIVLPATFDVADKGELSSNATILYTGTKEQAEQFGRSKVQSYAEWLAEGSPTNDSRIVYGYNVCLAFYGNEHDYTYEGSFQNDCASKCGRCNDVIKSETPNHNLSTVITYENGFLVAGLKVVDCNNAECGYHAELEANELISFVGISTSEKDYGICVGYIVDQAAVSEYTASGKIFRYGVVGYIPTSGENAEPVTNDVCAANEEKTIFAELSSEYTAFDFVIKGFAGAYMDLEIAMCAFVYDGTEVDYINTEISQDYKLSVVQSDTASTITYNKVDKV